MATDISILKDEELLALHDTLQADDRTKKLLSLRDLELQAKNHLENVVTAMQTVENLTREVRAEMFAAGFDTTTADAQIEKIAAEKAAIRNTVEATKISVEVVVK
jgi:hypothetical protein